MITVIIKYCGKKDNAKRFMEEMISSKILLKKLETKKEI